MKRAILILAIVALLAGETRQIKGAAIFVEGPGGSLTFLPPDNINAAFQGILDASGRSHVVITTVTRGGATDFTANGAVMNGVFAPTGLVTLEPIPGGFARLPVSVEQLAQYEGFDHFQWEQKITLPTKWDAITFPGGPPLQQPFTDPQKTQITVISPNSQNPTATTQIKGDGSGFYYTEAPAEWQQFFINPFDSYVPDPYMFTFRDTPCTPVATQEGVANITWTFDTYLVGVKYSDSTVSVEGPWFGYGTNFRWNSNTGSVGQYIKATGGPVLVDYLATPSLSDLPDAISGGISGIQYLDHSPSTTPEPSALTLLGTAGITLAGYGWRRRRRSATV